MAGRDPDAQHRGPDGEQQGRGQIHRLAVNPGVHRHRSAHLEVRHAPRSPWPERAIACYVENEDPELAGVKSRAGAGGSLRRYRSFFERLLAA